jgi:hypothetical protein
MYPFEIAGLLNWAEIVSGKVEVTHGFGIATVSSLLTPYVHWYGGMNDSSLFS